METVVHVPTSAGEVRGLTRTDSDADVYALETQFARMMNHQDILTEGTMERVERLESVVKRPSADEGRAGDDDVAFSGVSQPVITRNVSVVGATENLTAFHSTTTSSTNLCFHRVMSRSGNQWIRAPFHRT